jgi:hypothetical protein
MLATAPAVGTGLHRLTCALREESTARDFLAKSLSHHEIIEMR